MSKKMLLKNCTIYPMDSLPVKDGIIIINGSMIEYVGPSITTDPHIKSYDLMGKSVFPGFCDSHTHLVMAAEQKDVINLIECYSFQELKSKIQKKIRSNPEQSWITGYGWELGKIKVPGEDYLKAFETIAPDHNIFLISKDYHSAWVNTNAYNKIIKKLNSVVQYKDGEPTGLIFEDIIELKKTIIPPLSKKILFKNLKSTINDFHKCGITSIHNNENMEYFSLLKSYFQRAEQKLNILWNADIKKPDDITELNDFFKFRNKWIQPGGIKLFMDGALGSLTGFMSNPYLGTQSHGILNIDKNQLEKWFKASVDYKISEIVFHSIGDAATELVLKTARNYKDISVRLEHVQFLSEKIINDYDLSNVTFSCQPSHMWGDRIISENNLDRIDREHGYMFNSMIEKSGLIVFGSDYPIEIINPWKGIQAAVTRMKTKSDSAWNNSEAISLNQAIKAHTLYPASLYDNPFNTGTIAVGKTADLTVLNHDPFDFYLKKPYELWETIKSVLTISHGKIVYKD
ncbi:amidohydrolase family protein [bacterium]|nr:amidohydrolase family protein [bacterium]